MQIKIDVDQILVSKWGDHWIDLAALLRQSLDAVEAYLGEIGEQVSNGTMARDTFAELDTMYSDLAAELSHVTAGTPPPTRIVMVNVQGGLVTDASSNVDGLKLVINDLDVHEISVMEPDFTASNDTEQFLNTAVEMGNRHDFEKEVADAEHRILNALDVIHFEIAQGDEQELDDEDQGE